MTEQEADARIDALLTTPLGKALLADTSELAASAITSWVEMDHELGGITREETISVTTRAAFTTGLAVGLRFSQRIPTRTRALLDGVEQLMGMDAPEDRADLDRSVDAYIAALRGDA